MEEIKTLTNIQDEIIDTEDAKEYLEFADCLYPSDNDLEIPTLRMDMQPEVVDIPFVCYGEQARTYKMGHHGTLHFYTDDYRYGDIFQYPEKIAKHQPRNIVEPNFSLFCETPIAFGVQNIYKKRWLARAMQDKGIRIFVDLNVNSKFYAVNLLGVPFGWWSYCTRGYSDRLHYLEFEYEMAKQHAGPNADKLLFVIYAGGDRCKAFARQHNCVYISPMIDIKNDRKRAIKKIDESVAFLGGEFDPTHILQQSTENIRALQLDDFRKEKAIDKI